MDSLDNIEVLFEDKHLAVLAKPPGWLTQGDSSGDPSVVDWLRERWERPYVGLVHRLDRNTSGALVVAKRTKSARRLTEALQAGKLVRTYVAILLGELAKKYEWRHWLLKNTDLNQVRIVEKNTLGAREAVLNVDPIEIIRLDSETLTLAKFTLQTGRSHQIRAQAAAEGYPVLGDRKYGRSTSVDFKRQALHARQVSFPHPMSGDWCSFIAPWPRDFIQSVFSHASELSR